jgi:hypothetical protein
MPGSVNLVKAELQQIDLSNPKAKATYIVKVQFNPETLKVSFANQIQTAPSVPRTPDQRGTPATQFVGEGTTKLALQLWFDVNAPQEGTAVNDVRELTKKIAYFITPSPDPKDDKKFIPPGVRFIWGSFQFDGLMESLEESLEFFSSEGRPLRASMSLNLAQQKIDQYGFGDQALTANKRQPGTTRLTPAPSGSTVQGLAASQGKGGNWQSIAAANGIENPRRLQVGQLLDMSAKAGSAGAITGGVPLMNETGVSANSPAQSALRKE